MKETLDLDGKTLVFSPRRAAIVLGIAQVVALALFLSFYGLLQLALDPSESNFNFLIVWWVYLPPLVLWTKAVCGPEFSTRPFYIIAIISVAYMLLAMAGIAGFGVLPSAPVWVLRWGVALGLLLFEWMIVLQLPIPWGEPTLASEEHLNNADHPTESTWLLTATCFGFPLLFPVILLSLRWLLAPPDPTGKVNDSDFFGVALFSALTAIYSCRALLYAARQAASPLLRWGFLAILMLLVWIGQTLFSAPVDPRDWIVNAAFTPLIVLGVAYMEGFARSVMAETPKRTHGISPLFLMMCQEVPTPTTMPEVS